MEKKKKKKKLVDSTTEPRVDEELLDLVKDITKGTGVTTLDDLEALGNIKDYISTGSIALNIAITGDPDKGVPCGRLVEIFGDEATGKSTLAAHILKETQQRNGIAMLLEPESAQDQSYASDIGLNVETLLYDSPDTVEEVFMKLSKTVDIIFEKAPGRKLTVSWDSVAATPTREELEGDLGAEEGKKKISMASQARMISMALKRVIRKVAKTQTCLIFVNQQKEKVGVVFGSKYTTPGGRAIKFHASVRLSVKRVELIKKREVIIGIISEVKCEKNKCYPPFRKARVPIIFGKGIDRARDVLLCAEDLGLIKVNSGRYLIPTGRKVKKDGKMVDEFLNPYANQFSVDHEGFGILMEMIYDYCEEEEEE